MSIQRRMQYPPIERHQQLQLLADDNFYRSMDHHHHQGHFNNWRLFPKRHLHRIQMCKRRSQPHLPSRYMSQYQTRFPNSKLHRCLHPLYTRTYLSKWFEWILDWVVVSMYPLTLSRRLQADEGNRLPFNLDQGWTEERMDRSCKKVSWINESIQYQMTDVLSQTKKNGLESIHSVHLWSAPGSTKW